MLREVVWPKLPIAGAMKSYAQRRIMTAFYLDENVAVELAATLRHHGHGASTAADERRLEASDAHQLLYAAQRH